MLRAEESHEEEEGNTDGTDERRRQGINNGDIEQGVTTPTLSSTSDHTNSETMIAEA